MTGLLGLLSDLYDQIGDLRGQLTAAEQRVQALTTENEALRNDPPTDGR